MKNESRKDKTEFLQRSFCFSKSFAFSVFLSLIREKYNSIMNYFLTPLFYYFLCSKIRTDSQQPASRKEPYQQHQRNTAGQQPASEQHRSTAHQQTSPAEAEHPPQHHQHPNTASHSSHRTDSRRKARQQANNARTPDQQTRHQRKTPQPDGKQKQQHSRNTHQQHHSRTPTTPPNSRQRQPQAHTTGTEQPTATPTTAPRDNLQH